MKTTIRKWFAISTENIQKMLNFYWEYPESGVSGSNNWQSLSTFGACGWIARRPGYCNRG